MVAVLVDVDWLGEEVEEGTKDNEDFIPGITVGCGFIAVDVAITVGAGPDLFGWEILRGETSEEDNDGDDC